MSKEGLLMIFVKNPVKGKVKTRLAEEAGPEKALAIYEALLHYTKDITQSLTYSKKVYYSDFMPAHDLWDRKVYEKALQPDGDLGDKMGTCFCENLQIHQKVVIIGSDCPELETQHLEEAFEQLDDYDAVIGPAKDGGYYLLGLKTWLPDLFDNKSWSSSQVFEETVNTLKANGFTYYTLPTLNDIDTYEDLKISPWFREHQKAQPQQ